MSVGTGEHFFAKTEILRRDFDQFVVGYGMDVGHAFRELPFVGRVVD